MHECDAQLMTDRHGILAHRISYLGICNHEHVLLEDGKVSVWSRIN